MDPKKPRRPHGAPARKGRRPERSARREMHDPKTHRGEGSTKQTPGPPLPPGWKEELRDTVRPGEREWATNTIAEALSAHLSEDFARTSELAAKVKQEAPRSGRVRELLGLALYREGKFADALRELMTYRRLTGRKDQNHLIVDCYRAVGRVEKALEIAGEVKEGEVEAEAWSELAIVSAAIMADQGDFEKALARLARAVLRPAKVEPHHLRLWYARADLLERAGRPEQARKEWEAIIAEDPDFFDAAERLEENRRMG